MRARLVNFKLTTDEDKALRRAATDAGLSLSEYIRRRALSAAPKPDAEIEKCQEVIRTIAGIGGERPSLAIYMVDELGSDLLKNPHKRELQA